MEKVRSSTSKAQKLSQGKAPAGQVGHALGVFPPLMVQSDDAIAFLPEIDCVLLVVENGTTHERGLDDTIRLLEGVALVGIVLNKSDARQHHAYY